MGEPERGPAGATCFCPGKNLEIHSDSGVQISFTSDWEVI